jgi:NAD(P)-dependent dehydrogenase (short-subunit alcohol dehydrogenase family)
VARTYPLFKYVGSVRECSDQPLAFEAQHQARQPGLEESMHPRPIYDYKGYRGSDKLKDQVAIISGGDSGIGRAVAVAFAKEGADIAIAYLNEHEDAKETARTVAKYGRKCLPIPGDLRNPEQNQLVVTETIKRLGRLNILVNNLATLTPKQRIEDLSIEQWENTFKTNISAYFYMTKAALPYLKPGSAIINTSSVTAFEGSSQLLDYSTTKGAIVSFTRSLAVMLLEHGIRVNTVAPGPVWTPLIVAGYDDKSIQRYGTDTRFKRAAQPFELAPAYVYLASEDSTDVTGQVMHVNGGKYFGN